MKKQEQENKEQEKNYMKLYHSKSKESKDKSICYFVNNYENFIKQLMQKFCPTYTSKYFDDLLSCGKVGVLDALQKYDPDKGAFTTCSKPYIRHELYRFLYEMVFQCSEHYARLQNKLRKAIKKLKEDGIECTVENISQLTNMSLEVVKRELQMQNLKIVSLDEAYFLLGY